MNDSEGEGCAHTRSQSQVRSLLGDCGGKDLLGVGSGVTRHLNAKNASVETLAIHRTHCFLGIFFAVIAHKSKATAGECVRISGNIYITQITEFRKDFLQEIDSSSLSDVIHFQRYHSFNFWWSMASSVKLGIISVIEVVVFVSTSAVRHVIGSIASTRRTRRHCR